MGTMFLSGPIATLAAVTLFISGIYGIVQLIRTWPNMDNQNRIIAVLTFLTYVAFAGAVARITPPTIPEPTNTMSPIPESYFGKIMVNMRDAPANSPRTAANYPRNPRWFWKQVRGKKPEWFMGDKVNLNSSRSPIVTEKWCEYHPEHRAFMGETLIHHHVGQGPWAVPLPKSVHKVWSSTLHTGIDGGHTNAPIPIYPTPSQGNEEYEW